MKKLLMGLSDSILSRSQMKSIRGGYGGVADCTKDCPDPIPDVTCSGMNCRTFNDINGGGCESDTETKPCLLA
jgi:natural product precursor